MWLALGSFSCGLFTLIGAGIWIDIKWRLDSTTKLLLGIVFLGLFLLGALFIANLTGKT
jgi:ABC-type siderophore export system fused ATPase/permease subunit